MTFAEYIKKARFAKGWTQTQLAEKLGITLCEVSNIETGKTKRPNGKVFCRLVEVLELDKEEAFTIYSGNNRE